jgi:hypothetical protein
MWTGRHRRPFFDVSVLNAMSRVPLASGKIVHPVGNDVGVKQRERKKPGVWRCGFRGISGKLLKWRNFINSEWCFVM